MRQRALRLVGVETHSEDNRVHTFRTTVATTVLVRNWPSSGWQVDARFHKFFRFSATSVRSLAKMIAEAGGLGNVGTQLA